MFIEPSFYNSQVSKGQAISTLCELRRQVGVPIEKVIWKAKMKLLSRHLITSMLCNCLYMASLKNKSKRGGKKVELYVGTLIHRKLYVQVYTQYVCIYVGLTRIPAQSYSRKSEEKKKIFNPIYFNKILLFYLFGSSFFFLLEKFRLQTFRLIFLFTWKNDFFRLLFSVPFDVYLLYRRTWGC